MFIKGITEYGRSGEEVQTGLVVGRATKDADHRRTSGGKDVTTVSVRAYGRKDGSAAFLDVKCWGGLSDQAGRISKGDTFLAAGRLETREYKGKNYTDLIADFVLPLSPASAASDNFAALSGRMQDAGFADISEEDGELPF